MTPGTTVYNRSGHAAQFVSQLPHGAYAVRPQITVLDHEGEPMDEYDGLAEWHEVFSSPPVAKLNEEVAALNARIEELETKRNEIAAQIREQDREITARKDRLKQHEALARLDDYIAGKITHYVVRGRYSNAPSIITLEEAKTDDRYDKHYRVLTIDAKTSWGGKVEWSLNQYRDGSGSSDYVIPCCSYEEAHKEGVKIFETMLARWRTKAEGPPYIGLSDLITAAQNLKLPVPEDVAAADREMDRKKATEHVTKARQDLAEAEAKLAALS